MLVVLVLAVIAGLAAGIALPFREPAPVYLDRAEALLHHGQHAPNAFSPTGYMTFVFGGVALHGHQGVMLLQVLTYAGLVCASYALLRLVGVSTGWALLGVLLVALDPVYPVNINRITEVDLASALLVTMFAAALWIRRDGLSWGRAIVLGLTIGALDAVRPNFLSLLPVVLFLAWPALRSVRLLGLTAALLPPLASSLIMIGHPVFLSGNGPYNLAAGANDHTEWALLHYYDAEPSLYFYLRRFHVRSLEGLQPSSKESELTSFGLDYIKHHPANYVKLGGLKLVTTFRPDFRPGRVHSRFEDAIEVIVAFPAVLWILAMIGARRAHIRTDPLSIRVMVALVVLYLLPLVLTNGHPRIRYPLDTMLLLHTALIGVRWLQQRINARAAKASEPGVAYAA